MFNSYTSKVSDKARMAAYCKATLDAHPWTLLKSFKIALFQPAHLNNVFAATFFHATLKDLIIQLSAAKCSQVET